MLGLKLIYVSKSFPVVCNTKNTATQSWTNGSHFGDEISKWIFLNENYCILIEISLKFVAEGPIDNESALV